MSTLKNIEAVAALLVVAGMFPPTYAEPFKPLPSKSLERGRYLVKITGCNDCHTPSYAATGGQVAESQWLVGDRLGWRGPWGTTYPSNLRLFMSKISEDQWVETARKAMYRPPMPWFTLREIKPRDLRAMYRYITHLGPVGEPAPAYVPPSKNPKARWWCSRRLPSDQFLSTASMKLHFHPVSTTSRPIMMLAADDGIALDYEVVDLFTGAHLQPTFNSINPSQQVPVLEDGSFRLTESSAILKYLADQVGSPAYPGDLKRRARINECMDWFNTGLYRDLGYGLIYPQTLPNYQRPDPAAQAATLAWGRKNARRWLDILNQRIIGENRFVCGPQISLADYLGVSMLTLGEVIRLDYSSWKNVARWIDTMKARPNWSKVNEGFYTWFVAPYKDKPFEGL